MMNRPQFQSSFEEYIKPILNKSQLIKPVPKEEESSPGPNEPSKVVKNGTQPAPDFETYYWLDIQKARPVEFKKLGYQFQSLVNDVKHMKLPSQQWKIKIMVHKQEMVSVNFNNRQTPEKLVNINAKNFVVDVTIDGKKCQLIGAPVFVHSISDVEILLEIIDRVEPKSPLLHYF